MLNQETTKVNVLIYETVYFSIVHKSPFTDARPLIFIPSSFLMFTQVLFFFNSVLAEIKIINVYGDEPLQTNRELHPPIYLDPAMTGRKVFNFIQFLIYGIVVLIPFARLKNIKFNVVATTSLLMALNHFDLWNVFIETGDAYTPITWGPMFLSGLVIGILVVLNMLFKPCRVISSSMGGGYTMGYILWLFLNFNQKLYAGLFMLGATLLYVGMYFVLKETRKFILFSLHSGWLFYCCINICAKGQMLDWMYSTDKQLFKKGALTLFGVLSATLVIFSILRLVFYRKQKKNAK